MLSVFQILAILISVYWNLIVLVSISLMTYDVEHLFICLNALGDMSFKVFGPLKKNWVIFLIVEF